MYNYAKYSENTVNNFGVLKTVPMFAKETDNDYTSIVSDFTTSSNFFWTDASSDDPQLTAFKPQEMTKLYDHLYALTCNLFDGIQFHFFPTYYKNQTSNLQPCFVKK